MFDWKVILITPRKQHNLTKYIDSNKQFQYAPFYILRMREETDQA